MPETKQSDETPSENPGGEVSEVTPETPEDATTDSVGDAAALVDAAEEASEDVVDDNSDDAVVEPEADDAVVEPEAEPEAEPAVEATAERPAVDLDEPLDEPLDESEPAGETQVMPAAESEEVVTTAPLVAPAPAAPAAVAPHVEPEAAAPAPEPTASGAGSKGGKIAALAVAGGLVLAAGAYVAAHQMTTGKVPQGSTVAGVEIGGQSIAEAEDTLDAAFAARADEPLTVTVAGADAPENVTPEAAGLTFDHAATLEQAGASTSWAPTSLWAYFTGGDEIAPSVEVDDAALGTLLDRFDAEHGVKVREGRVRFEDGEVVTRAPRIGQVVDRDQAEEALSATFVAEDRAATVEVVENAPTIGEAEIEAALSSFAEPAVSAPVTLTSGDVSLELEPAEYTSSLKMVESDGALVPELKSDTLASLIKSELAEDGGPQEATVTLVNGQPKVVPDEMGVSFDQAEVDQVFLDLVAAPRGERTAEVKSVEARSDFTTEDAKKLNIVERVSSFETRYPYAEYRNVNLSRAAELINGTVLKPGEVFSLNEVVGERTRENGFTTGIMIADGVFREDLGGGVSQMATTVFNSMFFAGYEDVEHKPHSFYISRYPVGREATVAWGSVDLKFRNDTPHGVLVEAKVQKAGPGGQGVVQVSMWSTKVWDITTSTSGRYALTSPKTRTLSGPTCMPNSGYGGFDIDVKRYFAKPGSGKIEKTENFRTTYTPSDTVVCE